MKNSSNASRAKNLPTKNAADNCLFKKLIVPLQPQRRNGSLAEWLGAGLQNRLRRFESARNLWI